MTKAKNLWNLSATREVTSAARPSRIPSQGCVEPLSTLASHQKNKASQTWSGLVKLKTFSEKQPTCKTKHGSHGSETICHHFALPCTISQRAALRGSAAAQAERGFASRSSPRPRLLPGNRQPTPLSTLNPQHSTSCSIPGNHFCTILHHFLHFLRAHLLQINDLRSEIAPRRSHRTSACVSLVCLWGGNPRAFHRVGETIRCQRR